MCSRQGKIFKIHLGYHCKKSSETDAHNGDLVECSIAFRRCADSSQIIRTFKKVCHRFRLTKQDDYFWLNFDQFWSESHIWGRLGNTLYLKLNHHYKVSVVSLSKILIRSATNLLQKSSENLRQNISRNLSQENQQNLAKCSYKLLRNLRQCTFVWDLSTMSLRQTL